MTDVEICPICLDTEQELSGKKIPFVSCLCQCQKPYCAKCLEKLKDSDKNWLVKCPSCRSMHYLPDAIPNKLRGAVYKNRGDTIRFHFDKELPFVIGPKSTDKTQFISSQFDYLTNTWHGEANKGGTTDKVLAKLTFSDNFDCVAKGWVIMLPENSQDKKKQSHLGGRNGQLLLRTDHTKQPTPVHHHATLSGNVFVHGKQPVGYNSLHFEDSTPPYISFAHFSAAIDLPPLDNGAPLPSKVFFQHVAIEGNTLFRGTIDWEANYDTTWKSIRRQNYTIEFDSKYHCILRGNILEEFSNGTENNIRNLDLDYSTYVNAARNKAGANNLVRLHHHEGATTTLAADLRPKRLEKSTGCLALFIIALAFAIGLQLWSLS